MKKLLALVLFLFFILGVTYSVVVPPFEASDEKWHYPMVKFVADYAVLPVQEPGVETPWRQEGSQPPLYYALAALVTSWIDTSDIETVRHLNPHADAGATPDGNVNLAVHVPAREAFPWRGTLLAVHIVRLVSVLMSTAAVYLTFLIASEVVPRQPALAIGTAAVHAFTPMYVFISGSVNNDNLVVPLSCLALLILLRMVRPTSDAPNLRVSATQYVGLGFVLGLGALTKTSSLALTVLTALVVVMRATRRRSWREFIIGGLGTLIPLLLVAGWWYLRNLQLYGDISGLDVFIEILGQREVPADAAQLWRERFSFLAGYWGNFGGLNVPMTEWIYGALSDVGVVAAAGLVVGAARTSWREFSWPIRASDLRSFTVERLPVMLCLLWGLGVLIPWAVWASVTWSSQGRLVFPAITVWSLLLVHGLCGWFPHRWGPWVVGVFAVCLFVLAALTPWVWIKPAYAPPEQLTTVQLAGIENPFRADFGEAMRLLGYDLETHAVEPGGQVAVTLYWEAIGPADRDYTVFVHLLGEGDLLVAQRDTFPGLGSLSTGWLEPGLRWADRTILLVPDTAYSPDLTQVEVGLYDVSGGERLRAVRSDGEELGDNVRFGQVRIRSSPGDVPNPISVSFGDQMELTGYDLDRRVAWPGDEIALDLYWQGLRLMDVNYTVSAQLINQAQEKAAQRDAWPQDGAAPTVAWEPGEAVADSRLLTISPETAPGVYDVQLAVYYQVEGELVHLPVISRQGEMLSNHIALTRVRVLP